MKLSFEMKKIWRTKIVTNITLPWLLSKRTSRQWSGKGIKSRISLILSHQLETIASALEPSAALWLIRDTI